MMDIENQAQNHPNLEYMQVLDRHEDGLMKLAYSRSKMGFGMPDRDNIFTFNREVMDDGSFLYSMMTVEHEDYPETEEAVRMRIFQKTKVWQDGHNVKMVDLANFNVGGNLPTCIMNKVVEQMVMQSLNRIVDEVQPSEHS